MAADVKGPTKANEEKWRLSRKKTEVMIFNFCGTNHKYMKSMLRNQKITIVEGFNCLGPEKLET